MDKNTEKRYYLNRDRQKLIESLQASDYKIIKATEYAALGLECEYDLNADRKSTRLNSSHKHRSRMPSSA